MADIHNIGSFELRTHFCSRPPKAANSTDHNAPKSWEKAGDQPRPRRALDSSMIGRPTTRNVSTAVISSQPFVSLKPDRQADAEY